MHSQHPVDRLIRELVDTGRAATAEEVMRIGDRMATVLFASHEVRIYPEEQGASYQGVTLGVRADSLTYHCSSVSLSSVSGRMGRQRGNMWPTSAGRFGITRRD